MGWNASPGNVNADMAHVDAYAGLTARCTNVFFFFSSLYLHPLTDFPQGNKQKRVMFGARYTKLSEIGTTPRGRHSSL